MAELPILPIRTSALLSDTMGWSADEFGAYVRILLVMWQHGARLPHDEDALARIAGVSRKKWSSLRERVLNPMIISEGFISQKRLTDTWIRVQELRRKRSEAAQKKYGSKCRAFGYADGVQLKLKQEIDSSNGEIQQGASEGKISTELMERVGQWNKR